jgi:hypothetical protein
VSLYLAAALLPLVPAVASIAAAIGDGAWSGVTGSLVRAVTPDALLYSAACVVVAAPLAGVAVAAGRPRALARRREPALDTAWRLTIATLIFCAVSALLTVGRLGLDADTLRFVATSHAVLASATVALAALGALLGTLFRDPLDAAAVSVTVALAAAYGVLVAGATVGELPPPMLKAALLASPVMTVATAAHVDLVRTDIWYQISPLAHIRLEYPAWSTVCGSYLLAGCAGFLATSWCRKPEALIGEGRQ